MTGLYRDWRGAFHRGIRIANVVTQPYNVYAGAAAKQSYSAFIYSFGNTSSDSRPARTSGVIRSSIDWSSSKENSPTRKDFLSCAHRSVATAFHGSTPDRARRALQRCDLRAGCGEAVVVDSKVHHAPDVGLKPRPNHPIPDLGVDRIFYNTGL